MRLIPGLVILLMAIYAAQHGNYVAAGVCALVAVCAMLFVRVRL
jgi:hypothetical protein